MPNFTTIGVYCQITYNCTNWKSFEILGLPSTFTNQGQIWLVRVYPWFTLTGTCQI